MSESPPDSITPDETVSLAHIGKKSKGLNRMTGTPPLS